MGKMEIQNNGKTEYWKGGKTESYLIFFGLILAILFLNIITTTNSLAQNKKPKIQMNDTLPPAPQWELCCDGTVNVYRTKYVYDKPDDPKNRSNLFSITMDESKSYNYQLFFGEFEPCYDSYTDWGLRPIDKKKDALAVVTFTDCAGNDTTVMIAYFAINIDVVPKSQDFGFLSVGDSVDKMYYIVNKSETAPVGIKYLEFKRKDMYRKPQGFTIWDSTGTFPLPTVFGGPGNSGILVAPLDSFPFIVKFVATESGEFWDSIGLGDTCNFWYKSYAHAIVGSPIINVTDCEFPVTKINKWSYASFDVQNKGTVPLLIYGYNGPTITGIKSKNKIYVSNELTELNLSESNPLKLMPNEFMTFNVSFAPDEAEDFFDSIVFISNTIKDPHYNNNDDIDSVCILNGKGVLSGLLVNSYDWGRKRIHRPENFLIEPYPAIPDGVQDSAIRLTNNGYYAESVTRLTNLEEGGDISSFKMKRADLITTVSGGKSKVVPVSFQPTSTGEHLLKIMFSTLDAVETDAVSTLQGVGTVPRLETQDYDFGCTKLNDFDNYVIKNIIIRNLSLDEWEYGDTVTLYDFESENISENITIWENGKSFRYDKSSIDFPILLQPGASLSLPIEFVAAKSGTSTAKLTTKSDAEFEVTSNMIGYDTETNVEDLQNNEIRIYPNPSTDVLHLSGLPDGTKQIKILDVLGNEKFNYELSITNYDLVVNVEDFASGVYLIQVLFKSEIISKKLWIVR